MLDFRLAMSAWRPPVVKTVARDGKGIDDLAEAADASVAAVSLLCLGLLGAALLIRRRRTTHRQSQLTN